MPQVAWPEPTELAGANCHREALCCHCDCSPTEIHHLFTAQQTPPFPFPPPALAWMHKEAGLQTFLKLSQTHPRNNLLSTSYNVRIQGNLNRDLHMHHLLGITRQTETQNKYLGYCRKRYHLWT